MQIIPDEKTYFPEPVLRRGEIFAWVLAVVSGVIWLVFLAFDYHILTGIPILFYLFFISAVLISLSNWNERKMSIKVTTSGIRFVSALRNTSINWDEIRMVEAFPGSWGEKILVSGKDSYFSFRTSGKVTLRGQEKGRVGIKDGDELLRVILTRGNLKLEQTLEKKRIYSKKADFIS